MQRVSVVSQGSVRQNLAHYLDGERKFRKTWVLFDSGTENLPLPVLNFCKTRGRSGGGMVCAKSLHIMCQFWKLNDSNT